jgi:TetR/AcrR family transcriptional regulator
MGIAERREREKQQRQSDILDAAEKIIFSKGLESATMDDVASEAELSKGTLYLYFKNKEELYLGITLRGIQALSDLFQNVLKKKMNGFQRTIALGKAFHEFAEKYPDYFNALSYYELKELAYGDECPMATDCSNSGQDALDYLIQAIEEGIQDGSIKPELDPKRVAVLLWGMSSGIIQLEKVKGAHLQAQHGFQMDGIVDYMFEFIRCSLENK